MSIQRITVSLNTRQRRGEQERLRFSLTSNYRASLDTLVRQIQAYPQGFTRVSVNLAAGDDNYGWYSGRISELETEGYIEPTGRKIGNSRAFLEQNPNLTGYRFNYGESDWPCGVEYKISSKWDEFMARYRQYCSETALLVEPSLYKKAL